MTLFIYTLLWIIIYFLLSEYNGCNNVNVLVPSVSSVNCSLIFIAAMHCVYEARYLFIFQYLLQFCSINPLSILFSPCTVRWCQGQQSTTFSLSLLSNSPVCCLLLKQIPVIYYTHNKWWEQDFLEWKSWTKLWQEAIINIVCNQHYDFQAIGPFNWGGQTIQFQFFL